MKVGIITIHNVSNYGAVLQAYALKEKISEYSETYIIDFDNRHVSKSLDYIRFGMDFHSILGTGKDIARIIPRFTVINKFRKFISQNLNVVSMSDLPSIGLDHLCSGSDQIWNPACISNDSSFIKEYFLDLDLKVKKRFSYASSCGSYQYSALEENKLQEYLSKYDDISTREYEASKYLSKLTGREVEHVLDPTLLLTKEQWLEKLGDNNFRNGDYILLYVIKKTKLLKEVVEYVKSQFGIKVILINQGLYFSQFVDEHIRDAGPHDFISLFNNAKFVITDSFHGTTFSTIFQKPFLSISPGANVNRISSLLTKIGLENRIVHDIDTLPELIPSELFDEANKKLELERKSSISFIEKSLGL